MTPIISVIVPISNMGGKLGYLKEWVRAIDFNSYQVILVHDVKDEVTGLELQELVGRFEGKKPLLLNGQYGSPGAARNAGLAYAESSWVAFWDSDDQPNPCEFLKMVEIAQAESSSVAIGGYGKTSMETGFEEFISVPAQNSSLAHVYFEPGLWRWAFLKTVIAGLNFPEIRMAEDQVFLSRINLKNSKIYFHNRVVYSYSVHRTGQLTMDPIAVRDIAIAVDLELENYYKSCKPMDLFLTSILLKQAISAAKTRQRPLVRFVFKILLCIVKDFFKYKNKNILESIFLLTGYIRKRRANTTKTILAMGGLGNQLFQLAAGVYYSQGSDFFIDYSLDQGSSKAITLNSEFCLPANLHMSKRFMMNTIGKRYFNFCVRFSSLNLTNKKSLFLKLPFKQFLEFFLKIIQKGNWGINSGTGFDERVFSRDKIYLLGYFQTFRYFSDNRVMNILKQIQLKNPSDQYLIHKSEIINMNSLIVHIRLGDYLKESKFGLIPPEYFRRVINEVWKTSEFNQICLFSDHVKISTEYIPEELADKVWRPREELTSAAETLDLMRYGKGYVLSNSSFSWWAASLSHQSSPLVIAPEPWFQKEISPADLIPKNWLRVSKLDYAKWSLG